MSLSMHTDGLSFIAETTLNLDGSHELKTIKNQVAILTHIDRFESRPVFLCPAKLLPRLAYKLTSIVVYKKPCKPQN